MKTTEKEMPKTADSLTRQLGAREDQHLLAWHHQPRIVFKRAQGVQMWDVDGREYLDFVSGHINQLLGHNHPELVQAMARGQGVPSVFGSGQLAEAWGAAIRAVARRAGRFAHADSRIDASCCSLAAAM